MFDLKMVEEGAERLALKSADHAGELLEPLQVGVAQVVKDLPLAAPALGLETLDSAVLTLVIVTSHLDLAGHVSHPVKLGNNRHVFRFNAVTGITLCLNFFRV